MIRYFTLVTWEVSRSGESLASQCASATVSFCALGDTFTLVSSVQCFHGLSAQSLCLFRGRVNLAEWIGEMISSNFLDAIDEEGIAWIGGGRSTKRVDPRPGEGDRDRVDIVSCLSSVSPPRFPLHHCTLSFLFSPPSAVVIVNLLSLRLSN